MFGSQSPYGMLSGMGQQQLTPGAGMPPHGNAPFNVNQMPQMGQAPQMPPVQMPQQQQPMSPMDMGMLSQMLARQTNGMNPNQMGMLSQLLGGGMQR